MTLSNFKDAANIGSGNRSGIIRVLKQRKVVHGLGLINVPALIKRRSYKQWEE